MDFRDIRRLIDDLPAADEVCAVRARARERELTKPRGSLGRLEDIAAWVAAWQGRYPPEADPIQVLVFAGNHGVTAKGVSAYPAEVTAQMVANFAGGGAAINQLCRVVGASLEVHPLDLARPTADMTEAAAMSEAECAAAIAFGAAKVAADTAILCVGEMGIGNTTAAAALACALHGGSPADWVGPGAGVDAAGMNRKIAAVEAALARHRRDLAEPLQALRRLGGRELAAIVGAVAEGRRRHVPVLLDGYVCCAAAAVLQALHPSALDHCLVAHRSAEPGHGNLLAALGKEPLLELGMRLGEASGAVLAANFVKAAVELHNGMATFADAGVSDRQRD